MWELCALEITNSWASCWTRQGDSRDISDDEWDAAMMDVEIQMDTQYNAECMDEELHPLQIVQDAFHAADEIRQMADSNVDSNESSGDNDCGSIGCNVSCVPSRVGHQSGSTSNDSTQATVGTNDNEGIADMHVALSPDSPSAGWSSSPRSPFSCCTCMPQCRHSRVNAMRPFCRKRISQGSNGRL